MYPERDSRYRMARTLCEALFLKLCPRSALPTQGVFHLTRRAHIGVGEGTLLLPTDILLSLSSHTGTHPTLTRAHVSTPVSTGGLAQPLAPIHGSQCPPWAPGCADVADVVLAPPKRTHPKSTWQRPKHRSPGRRSTAWTRSDAGCVHISLESRRTMVAHCPRCRSTDQIVLPSTLDSSQLVGLKL